MELFSCFSTNDVAEMGLTDGKSVCQLPSRYSAGRIESTHLRDLGVSKFTHPALFTDGARDSTLTTARTHIGHIIETSADSKMFRVAARSIIARMKDVESWWDRAFRKLIGNAMAKHFFTLKGALAVSVAIAAFFPFPTSVLAATSIDGFPKRCAELISIEVGRCHSGSISTSELDGKQ